MFGLHETPPNLSMHILLEHINQDIKMSYAKILTQEYIKLNTGVKEISQKHICKGLI